MKNIVALVKKSSLYLVAMMTALGLTYYLGLAPLLHAQADFPDLPEFPDSQSSTSAPTQAQPAPVQTSPSEVNSAAIENNVAPPEMPNAAQSAPSVQPVKTQPPPVSRPSLSPSSGILFKHTRSYIGELGSPDRDPFRKPMYILELEEKSLKPQKTEEVRIDDKIEAIRRWPLRDYRLVGVIWDVRNPKAMIVDPSNTMHLLKRNYRIGDKDGIISAISEGTITVIQDNIPVVVDISGSSSK